jgi:hypothetical protein
MSEEQKPVCGSPLLRVNDAMVTCDLEAGHEGDHYVTLQSFQATKVIGAQLAENARLRAELERAKHTSASLEAYDNLRAERDSLRAQAERLRVALEDMVSMFYGPWCGSLFEDLTTRLPLLDHRSTIDEVKAATIVQARAALAASKGEET